MKTRIVIASSNQGKLAEFRDLLTDTDWECIPQQELGVSDADETGLSFIENAILKARHAAQVTGLPAIADDSGLCVEALDFRPGLYSARFAGEHGNAQANMTKLRELLRATPTDAPFSAFYISAIAMVRNATDPAPIVTEGRWHGEVIDDQRGQGGFGYDPMFLDPRFGQTAAELDSAFKNGISHRGIAMRKLHERLRAPDLLAD